MTQIANTMFGGWILAACYSWVLRAAFEVDVFSAWHWVPIVMFLSLIFVGACAGDEPQVEGTKS